MTTQLALVLGTQSQQIRQKVIAAPAYYAPYKLLKQVNLHPTRPDPTRPQPNLQQHRSVK